jgi:hypothetical protein
MPVIDLHSSTRTKLLTIYHALRKSKITKKQATPSVSLVFFAVLLIVSQLENYARFEA